MFIVFDPKEITSQYSRKINKFILQVMLTCYKLKTTGKNKYLQKFNYSYKTLNELTSDELWWRYKLFLLLLL